MLDLTSTEVDSGLYSKQVALKTRCWRFISVQIYVDTVFLN